MTYLEPSSERREAETVKMLRRALKKALWHLDSEQVDVLTVAKQMHGIAGMAIAELSAARSVKTLTPPAKQEVA